MPRFLVKQPNGLYAEFSTIVDAFTIVDMTMDDAFEHYKTMMGVEDARAKVKRGVNDEPVDGGPPGDGQSRWRECIETMAAVNPEELENQKREYPWIWAGKLPDAPKEESVAHENSQNIIAVLEAARSWSFARTTQEASRGHLAHHNDLENDAAEKLQAAIAKLDGK